MLKTERVELRLDQEAIENIDAWGASQFDRPSRSEAIRRLAEIGLGVGKPTVKFSDGEKLIVMMLRDLYKSGAVQGEINPDFIANTIWGGHYWALEWEYGGLFHNNTDLKSEVNVVVDILEMWTLIEEGYEKLTGSEKTAVKIDAEPFGAHVAFMGFDGNGESDRLSIARFLVDDLGRFSRFRGRELNAHMPTIDTYNRMMPIFKNMKKSLVGRSLGASEITALLNEQLHPAHRKKAIGESN